MSASVGVTCGACGADIGDQFYPGDAVGLLSAHIPACPYNGVRRQSAVPENAASESTPDQAGSAGTEDHNEQEQR